MTLSMQQIKDAVAREYQQATGEVHAFIAWLEGKQQQIDAAKQLLEANGFTVTAKT